ncbi:hypothetical protein L6164_008730 [Bauhinia variegata]|uniref:Uncharacterized protein n=1 Tax=Bauhinia variegata TaxID=167791 RepID=A0ACB9PHN6_BAUVA|nr:hypothetical protein L6164_008730 [Bauhinia variegata]
MICLSSNGYPMPSRTFFIVSPFLFLSSFTEPNLVPLILSSTLASSHSLFDLSSPLGFRYERGSLERSQVSTCRRWLPRLLLFSPPLLSICSSSSPPLSDGSSFSIMDTFTFFFFGSPLCFLYTC